jgi:hypothetical protein
MEQGLKYLVMGKSQEMLLCYVAQVSVITAGNRDILLFYVRRKECFQNFE